MNKLLAIATSTLLLTAAFPSTAQNGRLVESGCRQGTCWETYVLRQDAIHQNTLGGVSATVYAVEIETHNTYSGASRSTRWVQCSVSEPFVAFELPNDDLIYIHYINPGGEVFSYNSGDHQLYWAICHNEWSVNIWSPEEGLAQKAINLGYSTQLESEQREIPKGLFLER